MVKQSLQQSLQQKLSPQQIQLMKLIELSTLELEQKVKDELEVNPALDNDNDQSDLSENDIISEDIESSRENQDIDIDQYLSDDEIPEYKLYSKNQNSEELNERPPIVGGHTYLDELNNQLREVKLSKKELKIGKYILGCIDDDGYIRRTTEQIIDDLLFKENLNVELVEVERILSIVRNFDPPGVGAHNLQECLLLQLERKEKTESILFAIRIVKLQFKQFVNKHYDKICEKFKVDHDQLKKAIFEIEKLNPKPVSSSNSAKYTQQIIPDFTVLINEDDIQFYLNYDQKLLSELKVCRDTECNWKLVLGYHTYLSLMGRLETIQKNPFDNFYLLLATKFDNFFFQTFLKLVLYQARDYMSNKHPQLFYLFYFSSKWLIKP